MAEEEKPRPTWIRKTTQDPVFVTARESGIVSVEVPPSFLVEGKRILSIGEGLSDFTKQLAGLSKADVWAMDPIYGIHGKSYIDNEGQVQRANLFQDDPVAVSNTIRTFFDNNDVTFLGYVQQNRDRVSLPDKKKVVAGSVYEMPFPDKSFDLIVGNTVIEHLDLAQALPEIMRTLKPGGEVRFGGAYNYASAKNLKLYEHIFVDGEEGYELDVPPGNLRGGLDWVRDHPGVSVFIKTKPLDQFPKSLEDFKQRLGLEAAHEIIFRKAEGWPADGPRLLSARGLMLRVNTNPGYDEGEVLGHFYNLSERENLE